MHSGPKPKEDRSQVRHRVAVLDFTDIPDVPFDGPKLPARYRFAGGADERIAWPKATLRWWETIRVMPHAKDWTPTDWESAFATAEIHARLQEGTRYGGTFTELRARERKMGVTADDRRDQRIRYVKPSEATKREEEAGPVVAGATVTKLDDFRDLYGAGA